MLIGQFLQRARAGLTRAELVVLVFVATVVVLLLVPVILRVREQSRLTQCRNNLKQIALATHNYDDFEWKCLPPGAIVQGESPGSFRGSWNILLCGGCLGYPELFRHYTFTQGFDHPSNTTVRLTRMNVFLCPAQGLTVTSGGDPVSHYGAVCGTGEEPTTARETDGAFQVNLPRTTADFKDGMSHTLMYGEIETGLGSWCGPSVLRSGSYGIGLGHPKGFGSAHKGGALFAVADGRVVFLRSDLDPVIFRALCTIAGSDRVPEDLKW